MGYTHYWNRPRTIDTKTFEAIRQDFVQVLPALEAAGAPLGDLYGRDEPVITAHLIGFNGIACCGHASNRNVCIPWPAKDAHGIGSNVGVGGTLPYRTCSGDCSYESVYFPRLLEPDMIVGFCKTAFRPYDLAVTTFLTIAKHHLGDRIVVQTDGEPQHWADAFTLCQACLGYGSRASFHDGKLTSGEEIVCG